MLDGRKHRLSRVEAFQLFQVDPLDVAADAAFGEAERHPRLEPGQHPRLHLRVRGEEVIEAVRPGIHQPAHWRGAAHIVGLQLIVADIEPRSKVLPNGLFAVRLGGAAEIGQIIGFDPWEVVFRLSIDHPEHGLGIGPAMNVGDAPIVADDGDARCLGAPSRQLGR